MGLRNKDLISIHDLSVGEVATILDVAKKLKRKQKNGEPHQYLKGKTLGMIFSKASTRTRVSFEVGFWQLGGHPIYLNDSASQIGRGEPVRDTARVLSRFVDGIMIRTFSHESVLELAKYASIPVINGLTDMLHPCQALTDLFTIMEYKEVLKGRKLVYVGDGNNMAHSLMYACAKVGMNMVCACPQGYQPDPVIVKTAQEDAVHPSPAETVAYADAQHHHAEHDDHGGDDGRCSHLHDFLEREVETEREEGEDDTDVGPGLDIRLVDYRHGVGHVWRNQESRHDVSQHQRLLEPLEDEGYDACYHQDKGEVFY